MSALLPTDASRLVTRLIFLFISFFIFSFIFFFIFFFVFFFVVTLFSSLFSRSYCFFHDIDASLIFFDSFHLPHPCRPICVVTYTLTTPHRFPYSIFCCLSLILLIVTPLSSAFLSPRRMVTPLPTRHSVPRKRMVSLCSPCQSLCPFQARKRSLSLPSALLHPRPVILAATFDLVRFILAGMTRRSQRM